MSKTLLSSLYTFFTKTAISSQKTIRLVRNISSLVNACRLFQSPPPIVYAWIWLPGWFAKEWDYVDRPVVPLMIFFLLDNGLEVWLFFKSRTLSWVDCINLQRILVSWKDVYVKPEIPVDFYALKCTWDIFNWLKEIKRKFICNCFCLEKKGTFCLRFSFEVSFSWNWRTEAWIHLTVI